MNIAKHIEKLKKKMYEKDTSFNTAMDINDWILDLDYERATADHEKLRASKEWYYRMRKYCDYKAGL